MNAEQSIEGLVAQTLRSFTQQIFDERWVGKERDCVNRYVHEHLMPDCTPGSGIDSPLQVSIEVIVPQPPGHGSKPGASKDVVVWPKANMTAWEGSWRPSRRPVALLEWKVRRTALSRYDLEFLRKYAEWAHPFEGFAITLDFQERLFRLQAARITRGGIDQEWLIVPKGGSPQ